MSDKLTKKVELGFALKNIHDRFLLTILQLRSKPLSLVVKTESGYIGGVLVSPKVSDTSKSLELVFSFATEEDLGEFENINNRGYVFEIDAHRHNDYRSFEVSLFVARRTDKLISTRFYDVDVSALTEDRIDNLIKVFTPGEKENQPALDDELRQKVDKLEKELAELRQIVQAIKPLQNGQVVSHNPEPLHRIHQPNIGIVVNEDTSIIVPVCKKLHDRIGKCAEGIVTKSPVEYEVRELEKCVLFRQAYDQVLFNVKLAELVSKVKGLEERVLANKSGPVDVLFILDMIFESFTKVCWLKPFTYQHLIKEGVVKDVHLQTRDA